MATIKLTKTELRSEQVRLGQLQKYLPTLQLKKAMLQLEVGQAQAELEALNLRFKSQEDKVGAYCALFSDKLGFDLMTSVKVITVEKRFENIAGVDIPFFEKVVFERASFILFDAPVWLESAIDGVRTLLTLKEEIKIVLEKKKALEKELREVSIRVNLFEKIMIPRAMQNIKKIKIFLSDQQLAAVSQAKVSKRKILMKNEEKTS
ncbi:MAG: V-type ATP synthase subunit D [Anaerolineae bacterium]